MHYTSHYESPFGNIITASDGTAVCGLWFEKHRYLAEELGSHVQKNDNDPALLQLNAWLDAYFAKARPAIDELPLAPTGTGFRITVWNALKQIPYGETVTYGELAQEIAKVRGKASPRSVGGAVGHNPISIVVPCHRVVGAGGSLTGFGGGIDKKVLLLTHEGVNMSKFFVPSTGTAL